MKTYMTRIFTVALLLMFSLGASADVKVEIGEFTGGTIKEKGQTKPDENGLVTVTITVTPDKGYTIKSSDITVVSTYPLSDSRANTRDPEIAAPLTLLGKDPEDLGDPRDYTFIVASTLGVWVKEANFHADSKGGGNRDISNITSLSEITAANGNYVITADIDASGFTESIASFSGSLEAAIDPETNMPYRIRNLSVPLFTTLTGTVKNLVLENVSITSGDNSGNTGAIACTATGKARIYNIGILSGSVGGTGYTGGLVGLLDGKDNANKAPRVVNCYSYADIIGGTNVGGIVGHNNYSTNKNNLRSMVFGCLFYGDITGGSNKAPIYNGEIISNKDNSGVGNFNYFRAEASFAQKQDFQTANCALMAETRFLQRFEFFRHLLNGHRELAAWWATGDVANKDQMLKWVMEPSQIGSSMPYPILKEQGYYPSVVNLDAENATTGQPRNKGGKLGELAVTIEMGSGGEQFDKPDGATITQSSLTLNITDKDPEHFNFNYGKVQLPYYNDVGTKNYSGDRVVVGWKITSITGGTPGTLSIPANDNTPADAPYYNYADRKCTNKDLYSVSKRVFNQGDYWDVPEGVEAITIQPYWAKAAYVADDYRDVVFNTAMTTKNYVGTVAGGQWFTNGNLYDFTFKGETLSLTVYSEISNAVSALSISNSHTVNDYAVVLVGNHHYYNGKSNNPIGGSKVPYTVMSADFDCDNEPDYSLIMRFDGRAVTHPVKYDFLCMPGFGMAQKSTGGTGSYNFGIPKPNGWFEVTNTALFRVTQMEYSPSSRAKKPIILHGGVIEQWVSTQGGSGQDAGDRTSYFHMGDNVWFKEFHIGVHQDYKNPTPHPPVSVTGGDYDEFALTGLYRADANHYNDNAECYINGGRFGKVYGAGREGIGDATNKTNGNITWQIDNADMDEFYGGGINFAHTAQGSISTTISNSHVGIFCGGPKFGDMNEDKTVTTTATNCTFGTYFGAGYGGNSYNRQAPKNYSGNTLTTVEWNRWIKGEVNAGDSFGGYKQEYNSSYNGVSTQFNYQFIPMSGNTGNVGRLFVEFVGFSLAKTRNVTSNLTGCTITGNFYGGGSLGKVEGPVTSTLEGCTVNGSVFGAGYSASIPSVEVDSIGFRTEPYYYTDFGTYRTGVKGKTTTYTWEHKDKVNNTATAINKNLHILYTTEDLNTLGTVTGTATLNIETGTTVVGSVYGGGESSDATGKVVVNINGGTINGNVHGGGYGKQTEVGGDVEVNIGSRTGSVGSYEYAGNAEILGDVYGGSAFGSVNTNTDNTTTVNLFGGTIHGDAYGGGLGQIGRAAKGTEGQEGYLPAIEDVKAQVKGVVNMTLDGAVFEIRTGNDDKGNSIPVSGRIFGCNNLNGSPEGNVNVTIERTSGNSRTAIENITNEEADHYYQLAAVYGGGNLAAYLPSGPNAATDPNRDYKNSTAKAHITINGCNNVSIQQVYGGGNAASTPAAQIDVNGTYEIEELFGGGNGKDRIQKNGQWMANPGANMGFLEYADDADNAQTPSDRAANYGYGDGKTNVNILGGRIHRVFGGANTKGNVRKIALTILEDDNLCDFLVDEAYGGGKSASMDGSAELRMACIPGLKAAYGGAQEANIHNDVVLNITNGTYDRVFGGNNKSGTIDGTITLNVEETGCRPVIIGQLYGGGNLAPYTAPANKPGPTINVKSFTSIGEVYGGGFGATAKVTGDTYVNVNEVILSKDDTGQTVDFSKQDFVVTDAVTSVVKSAPLYDRPAATTGSIGVIGNIYGGGNEAEVIGNTHVNIGNLQEVEINTLDKVEENYQKKTVVGADIRGNVYGGGNKAIVTGNTNVVIGREDTTTPAPSREFPTVTEDKLVP